MIGRWKRILAYFGVFVGCSAVGFGAVEWMGITNLGSGFWRDGPQTAIIYSLLGACLTALALLMAFLASYAFLGVAALGVFIVGLPKRFARWLDRQGVPGAVGLALHLGMLVVIGVAFVLLGGGVAAVIGFWLNAAFQFAMAAFVGFVVVVIPLTLGRMVLEESGPARVREFLVGDDFSSRSNAAMAVASVPVAFFFWHGFWTWSWSGDLASTSVYVPDGAPSTPLATFLFLSATAIVTFLAVRGLRVFRDRHRLFSKAALTPVWSHTEQLEPEPVDGEFWSNEPVTGWRAWTWDGRAQVLVGVVEEWPSATKVAVCGRPAPCLSPPGWDCNCGIYAHRTVDSLWTEDRYWRPVVWGQVRLSGRVVEHEDGWRASEATIARLWLVDNRRRDPAGLLEALNRRYPGVGVQVVDGDVISRRGDARLEILEDGWEKSASHFE